MPQRGEATLIWLRPGLKPQEGCRTSDTGAPPTQTLPSLRAAVMAAEQGYAGTYLPWIKPHGYGGAPYLNRPQIAAVGDALGVSVAGLLP